VTSQEGILQEVYNPRFMYHFASPNYYELLEDWEVEENTNINVLEETKENNLRPFGYVKA
jgi:hypothetical protein